MAVRQPPYNYRQMYQRLRLRRPVGFRRCHRFQFSHVSCAVWSRISSGCCPLTTLLARDLANDINLTCFLVNSSSLASESRKLCSPVTAYTIWTCFSMPYSGGAIRTIFHLLFRWPNALSTTTRIRACRKLYSSFFVCGFRLALR